MTTTKECIEWLKKKAEYPNPSSRDTDRRAAEATIAKLEALSDAEEALRDGTGKLKRLLWEGEYDGVDAALDKMQKALKKMEGVG